MTVLDLKSLSLRHVNSALQHASAETSWVLENPMGKHAVAAGLRESLKVDIKGSVGYYCGGMNKNADVIVHGSVVPASTQKMS